MKRLIFSMLVVLAIATAVVGCKSGGTTSSGNTELQGTWVNSTTGLLLNTITFNFNSNQWNMTWAFGSESNTLQMNGTFTINPSANPKAIDMIYTSNPLDTSAVGKTTFGIYELSGNSLKLDLGDPVNRPTVFTENGTITLTNVVGGGSSNTAGPTPTPTSTATPTPTLTPTPTPTGIPTPQATMKVMGSVSCTGNATAAQIVSFQLSSVLQGADIDLGKCIVNYQDAHKVSMNISGVTGFTGLLHPNEIRKFTIDVSTYNLGAYDYFAIEIIPPTGATIQIRRNLPGKIDAIMNLY